MFFLLFNNVEDDFPLIDYREGIEEQSPSMRLSVPWSVSNGSMWMV